MESDGEENEVAEVEVEEKPVKPKKVLSEAQLEVLRNARILAAERKKAMRKEKDAQLNAIKNKYKSKEKKKIDGELEEKPLKQQIEEKELKEKELPKKELKEKELKQVEEDLAKVAIKDEKPKKKKKKPVVILHGSSSESSDEDQQIILYS